MITSKLTSKAQTTPDPTGLPVRHAICAEIEIECHDDAVLYGGLHDRSARRAIILTKAKDAAAVTRSLLVGHRVGGSCRARSGPRSPQAGSLPERLGHRQGTVSLYRSAGAPTAGFRPMTGHPRPVRRPAPRAVVAGDDYQRGEPRLARRRNPVSDTGMAGSTRRPSRWCRPAKLATIEAGDREAERL